MVISQLGSRHFQRQMDSLKMDLQSDRSFELGLLTSEYIGHLSLGLSL